MIKIELTVREALALVSNGASLDMYDRIVCAIENAMNVNDKRTVTIVGGMDTDNRVLCIKAIRLRSGLGLKECKDWTDKLVGCWKYNEYAGEHKYVEAAKNASNSLTLNTPEAAQCLLDDLVALGCKGYVS